MAKGGFRGGFGGGMSQSQMMKQAQKMQQDFMRMQQELEQKTFTAKAGGGAVEATVNGKRYSQTRKVKVKEIPVTKAETIDHRGRRMSKWKQWMSLPKWQSWRMRFRQGWQMLTPEKRLASRLLLILGGVMLLAMLLPALLILGLFGLSLYLMWIVMRR